MSDIIRCKVCVFGDPDTGFGRSGYGFCRKSRVAVIGETTIRKNGDNVSTLVFGWPTISMSPSSNDGCGEGKEKATP